MLEALRSPPLIALALLNGAVLTAGLAIVAGPGGAVAGLAASGFAALAVAYLVGRRRALNDFVSAFAAARAWERVRMYRLACVTPLTREGGPGRPVGIGDAHFASTGALIPGRPHRVTYTRTWIGRLGGAVRSVRRHTVSVFLVELDLAGASLPRILCDPLAEPRTHQALMDLPRQRLLPVEGLTPGGWQLSCEECADGRVLRAIFAEPFRGWLQEAADQGWGWQVEGSHLCAWFGAADREEDLQRGLDVTAHVATHIAGVAERVAPTEGHRPSVARPALPERVPERLRSLARDRELEYWADAEPPWRFAPFRAWTTICGDVLAGEIATGLPGAVCRVRATVQAQRRSDRSSEVKELDFCAAVVEVPAAMRRFPWLACRDRRGQIAALIGGPTTWRLPRALDQESAAFAERYGIKAAREISENQLTQLFSPSFLIWHVDTELEPLFWHFERGWLCVASEGTEVTSPRFRALCDAAARIARRLREEAEE